MTQFEEFLVVTTLVGKLRDFGCNIADVDTGEVDADSVDRWAQCTFDHLDAYMADGEDPCFSLSELYAIQKLSKEIAVLYTLPKFEIVTFEDADHLDWGKVNNVLSIYKTPYIVPVVTGSDEHAILICNGYISQKHATMIYQKHATMIYACGPLHFYSSVKKRT